VAVDQRTSNPLLAAVVMSSQLASELFTDAAKKHDLYFFPFAHVVGAKKNKGSAT
jgi:hypothetical protein